MTAEPSRNSFRAMVLQGVKPVLVVEDKVRRHASEGDTLDRVLVSRFEARRGNHRQKDRHRLRGETATLRYEGAEHLVEVVNLSAGGAKIRTGCTPKLWDIVELQLGEDFRLEGAVRWIKGDSIGLEFAHETRIECDPKERAGLLLEVIRRSFGDQYVHLEPVEVEQAEVVIEELGKRDQKRHPLIWLGEIHFAHDSNPIRLRNVSAGGALLEVAVDYPVGAEVLIDLRGAGQFFAIVQWTCGDQAGVRFVRPFDMACLANARPEVTPHSWTAPSFLNRSSDEDDSPWHENWSRSSVAEIRNELEGFLKR